MSKRILFIVAALILATAGFYARAQNTRVARAQAAQIVQQDSAGSDTSAAIAGLKQYFKTHLSTSVGLTLNGAYTRALAAARAAASTSVTNAQIYADAQRACGGKSDSITQARCNQDYLSKHLVNVPPPTPVKEPKLSDYQYFFSSPVWAPDLPGALLLGSAAAFILGAAGFLRRPR
ncbi:MAG: hypothetical protein JWN01_139 [Patescibacteria group bacterium]|nr:hypothetical protein [Patescibacteria group bacterium]